MDTQVPEVEVVAVAGAVAAGAVLVDVREPDEFAEVRAAAARLIPLGSVGERLEEFPRGEAVYVICRSGARSMRACEALRSVGVDAHNVIGGTLAWVEADLPTASGPDA